MCSAVNCRQFDNLRLFRPELKLLDCLEHEKEPLTLKILEEHAVLLAVGLLIQHNQEPVPRETRRPYNGNYGQDQERKQPPHNHELAK
jgi:hypothetical protein